jgi:hypothetical protein
MMTPPSRTVEVAAEPPRVAQSAYLYVSGCPAKPIGESEGSPIRHQRNPVRGAHGSRDRSDKGLCLSSNGSEPPKTGA